MAFGSDFPIEGINPLLGFYAAVTRLSVAGTSPHGASGWHVFSASFCVVINQRILAGSLKKKCLEEML